MSGDCGHGWGYHSGGPASPCDKCTEERKKIKDELTELETLKTIGPTLIKRRDALKVALAYMDKL